MSEVKEAKWVKSEHASVSIGNEVQIVLKKDQRSGNLTRGTVARILTKSAYHRHGIKVMLTTGQVGRVKEVIEPGVKE